MQVKDPIWEPKVARVLVLLRRFTVWLPPSRSPSPHNITVACRGGGECKSKIWFSSLRSHRFCFWFWDLIWEVRFDLRVWNSIWRWDLIWELRFDLGDEIWFGTEIWFGSWSRSHGVGDFGVVCRSRGGLHFEDSRSGFFLPALPALLALILSVACERCRSRADPRFTAKVGAVGVGLKVVGGRCGSKIWFGSCRSHGFRFWFWDCFDIWFGNWDWIWELQVAKVLVGFWYPI